MYGDLQGLIGSSLHNIPALTHENCDKVFGIQEN